MAGYGSAPGERRGGRQKGTPNKFSADLKAMIMGALNGAGGEAYLQRQATDNPAAFLTLVGKVLPLQLAGDPDHPVQFVIRGPSPVESANDWLKAHAPQRPTIDVESE